jgi:hypothetical protein
MRTHLPAPDPELVTDARALVDTDGDADPWSTGSIVFSLGPDFDDPSFEPR